MKKVLLTFALLLFTSALYAQQDSHTQAVNELMETMHMQERMNESAERIFELQAKQMPQAKQFQEVMMNFFEKYINWETIGSEVKQIYKKNFTENEIRELTAFMKTKTGQKFSKKSADMMQQVAEISQKITMKHQAELQQKIMEAMQNKSNEVPSDSL